MYRALLAIIFPLLVAGCASSGIDDAAMPHFRYTIVSDGRIARTLSLSTDSDELSVIVQPRSGESAIWQIYQASYAYIVLKPNERDATPSGGRELKISGEVEYYRELKMIQKEGNDIVTRGKPIRSVEVPTKLLTVEPGKPVIVPLTEGLQVEIALLPPKTGLPGAK